MDSITHLNAALGEFRKARYSVSGGHIRIVTIPELALQYVNLFASERGSRTALFGAATDRGRRVGATFVAGWWLLMVHCVGLHVVHGAAGAAHWPANFLFDVSIQAMLLRRIVVSSFGV